MASLTDSMDALTTAAPPFVCGITREMPEKPVELIECGHLFDQDALRRWRAAGKTRCPECGGALDSRPSSVVAASLRAYRARIRRVPRAYQAYASDQMPTQVSKCTAGAALTWSDGQRLV